MAHVSRQPCDEGIIRSKEAMSACTPNAAPWVLAATILAVSAALLIEGKRPKGSAEQTITEREVAPDPMKP